MSRKENAMKPLNKYIDHTNLKPFATKGDIEKLCAEAKEYDFASVCVKNYPSCAICLTILSMASDLNL